MPGFEDVNWNIMFIEMLKALPCFIASLLFWWIVLKKRDREKVFRKKISFKLIKDSLSIKKIKDKIVVTIKSLSPWKWIVTAVITAAYLVIGILIKGNNDLSLMGLFLVFLFMTVIAGMYSAEDFENIILIAAIGLLGSRHGSYFSGFNAFYPIGSLVIAIAIFLPGEIKTLGKEKSLKIQKKEEEIGHNKAVYFLPTGFLITSILYFLTSF